MKIIYGTGNTEKINQVKDYIKAVGLDVEIITIKDIGFHEKIEENGNTFEENSLIKAKAIKAYCNQHGINGIIVTDDAGLCVDSLKGAPGVYSARYAGDHAPQEVTLKKLLDNMEEVKDNKRTAKFVCVLTAILPNGDVKVAKGETLRTYCTKTWYNGKINIWSSIYSGWI